MCIRDSNGVEAWALSPSKYVQDAISNVKAYITKHLLGYKMVKKATAPFPRDYHPECDISKELLPEMASFYSSQVGILRWMVELGRVDILTEVSLLSSHLAMPREGHLDALLHLYVYLGCKHNSRMAFDPTYPRINQEDFQTCDWKGLYGDAQGANPTRCA